MRGRLPILVAILVIILISIPLFDIARFGRLPNDDPSGNVVALDEDQENSHTIKVGPFKAYSTIDGKDRSIKYVRVKAETPDGEVYVERTDVEGYAYFFEMPFEEFPNGTQFSVRSFTFSDPIWEQGEDIPKLENDYWEFVTFSSIVYGIPLVVFLFLLLTPKIRIRKKEIPK